MCANAFILYLCLMLSVCQAQVKRIRANRPMFIAVKQVKRALAWILTDGQGSCRSQSLAVSPVRGGPGRLDVLSNLREANQSCSIDLFGRLIHGKGGLSANEKTHRCRACDYKAPVRILNAGTAREALFVHTRDVANAE
jgi:hypothetical protein